MSAAVTKLRPAARSAAKPKASRMDTITVRQTTVTGWLVPPFQRPLRVNDKVRLIAEQIRIDGGVIPGVLTIGRLDGHEYIVDGQHRLQAFQLSECPEALADVRYIDFQSMADMADEFVALNSVLVRMNPDDVLRGMESGNDRLAAIRRACPFVGYDSVRRSERTSMLSMSVALWIGSTAQLPRVANESAMHLAGSIDPVSTAQLITLLTLLHESWGNEQESRRLWSTLNLGLVMWLWRRMVLAEVVDKTRRYTQLSAAQFRRCVMSLAADSVYNDWLLGRRLGDRDRSACYARIRTIFMRRLLEDKVAKPGEKPKLPNPPWLKD